MPPSLPSPAEPQTATLLLELILTPSRTSSFLSSKPDRNQVLSLVEDAFRWIRGVESSALSGWPYPSASSTKASAIPSVGQPTRVAINILGTVIAEYGPNHLRLFEIEAADSLASSEPDGLLFAVLSDAIIVSKDNNTRVEMFALLQRTFLRNFSNQESLGTEHLESAVKFLEDYLSHNRERIEKGKGFRHAYADVCYDLAEFYFSCSKFAEGYTHTGTLQSLDLVSLGYDSARISTIHQICAKMIGKHPLPSLTSKGNASQAPVKKSALSMLLHHHKSRDFGPDFIAFIIADLKKKEIPTTLLANLVNELFEKPSTASPATLAAGVKLAFLCAVFAVDKGIDAMEEMLPAGFYRQTQTAARSVISDSVNGLIQILRKCHSALSTPSMKATIVQFTYKVLSRLGNIESFRALTKCNLFESIGSFDVTALQAASWPLNSNSLNFSAFPPRIPPDTTEVFLKRKWMTSLTVSDLQFVRTMRTIPVPILIAMAQRFIERNQYKEAQHFLHSVSDHVDGQNRIHIAVLLVICKDLDEDNLDSNFSQFYPILIKYFPSVPQPPVDFQAWCLLLAMSLRRAGNEHSAVFEEFIGNAIFEFQKLTNPNNPHFETLKLILSPIRQNVQITAIRSGYEWLDKVMFSGWCHSSFTGLHRFDILPDFQDYQIAEVGKFVKELVQLLSPSVLYDAKFVKDVQKHFVSILVTAKNSSHIALVGAVVAGFFTHLHKHASTRIQLKNFGALAFLTCPPEFIELETSSWVPRLAALVKHQASEFSDLLHLEGTYIVKFLIMLYNTTTASPQYFLPSVNSSFALGDLMFVIGNYQLATQFYMNGLVIESDFFANFEAVKPLLCDVHWNYRIAQCLQCLQGLIKKQHASNEASADSDEAKLQSLWLHLGVVVLAQFSAPRILAVGNLGRDLNDYQMAFAALDSAVNLLLQRSWATEEQMETAVEEVFGCLYDITVLEYLVCSFEKRSKHGCMKAAICLISRKAVGNFGDDFQQSHSATKLSQSFLRDLARRLYE
ncbi:hypothetical protein HDU83_000757 [Entophlyctis luteolus]|nr:hypothetical protein HDU83_000757 [Entophlyctis luteolus]